MNYAAPAALPDWPDPRTATLAVRSVPGKGRGVVALVPFAAHETIELAPVVLAPPSDRDTVMSTILRDHTFRWDEDTGEFALCLGFGSLYNHSFAPNACYVKHSPSPAIRFIALRPIALGEEVTVNYNGAPADGSAVWFEVQP